MVPVAGKFEREEDPEGVAAFGEVEWCLASLRVDLEVGEGALLASSPSGIDSEFIRLPPAVPEWRLPP